MNSQLPSERKHKGHQNQLPHFSPADLGGNESHAVKRLLHSILEQRVVRAHEPDAVLLGAPRLVDDEEGGDLTLDTRAPEDFRIPGWRASRHD